MVQPHYVSRLLISTAILFTFHSAMADTVQDQLDAAFSAQDTARLYSIIEAQKDPVSQREVIASIKQHVDSGEAPDSLAIGMFFVYLRQRTIEDALTYLDYYREILIFDGMICPNPDSPGHLLESSIFLPGALLRRLVATKSIMITSAQQQHAVDKALAIEAANSSARRIDPALCASGLNVVAQDLHMPTLKTQVPSWTTPTPRYADNPAWVSHRTTQLPTIRNFLLQMNGATSQ